MPSLWRITCAGIDPRRAVLSHLHAVAARWVDHALPGGHAVSPKPWAVTPLRAVEGLAALDFSCLTPDAEGALLSSVVPGPVRFGSMEGEIIASPQLVLRTTWDALTIDTECDWTVNFLTPTTFRRGSRSSPLPDPLAVARSLSTRWEAFAPQGLLDPRLGWEALAGIWVSDIAGANDVIDLGKLVISGFRGRVRYAADDAATGRIFGSLLRLGEFSGIGSYPTRGLGVARIEVAPRAEQPEEESLAPEVDVGVRS